MSVVSFPTKANEQRIWVCGCGCSTFELLEDGSARCALCAAPVEPHPKGAWWTVPDNAEEASEPPQKDIQGNGSVEFARRRLQQLAQDDDAVMLMVVRSDSSVSLWADAETNEQIEWSRRRLEDADGLLARWLKESDA
ncbi:MAG: hypothetical protein AAFQ17_00790 [Pseudomonadota bacterium]